MGLVVCVGIQATCGSWGARRVRGNGGMFRAALTEPQRPVCAGGGLLESLGLKVLSNQPILYIDEAQQLTGRLAAVRQVRVPAGAWWVVGSSHVAQRSMWEGGSRGPAV